MMDECFSKVKHYLIGREGTIFAKGRCKIGITFKKGEARCPDDRGGKSATACGKKTRCQEIMQQLVHNYHSGPTSF